MSAVTPSEHIRELSRELLDDIELNRLPSDKLLLKCSRLARLVGSEETQAWIEYEMRGYNDTEEISLRYADLTGRWIDRKAGTAYWGPLAQQEASIAAMEVKLASLKLPAISGDYVAMSINNIMANMQQTANSISAMSAIRSRVLAYLHSFVSGVYYEREFSSHAETTFERYKRDVDALIAAKCGNVLKKIPAVIDRLSEAGDEESVSQALTTCRRILEAFADAVYPASEGSIELGGNTLKLDVSKHQNRINAYIAGKTASNSRRQKLRQNLSNLFDRVSAGVHNDVTREEAFSLFLNTYLFLGEVLQLVP